MAILDEKLKADSFGYKLGNYPHALYNLVTYIIQFTFHYVLDFNAELDHFYLQQ